MVESSFSSADLGASEVANSSASDSDRVTSSLANLLCTGRMNAWRLSRAVLDRVMVVIERDDLEIEVDGRERARKATRRRENLDQVC